MKLGIDFGTTRTVVAAADRGNFPLVNFELPDESTADWYPSVVALRGKERLYGWKAWAKQTDDSWTILRSVKRLLEDAGPRTMLELGEYSVPLIEILQGFAAALAEAIRHASNLGMAPGEELEVMVGVPAHANTNQRYLTIEAFRGNGMRVLGVLNEPSAASIEYGHRQREDKRSISSILVYDLGGGTFDASLVKLDGQVHHVLCAEGIPTIGGDDFDHLLADLALDLAGLDVAERDAIPAGQWFRLLEECRTKKESLNPNSRRLVIDLEAINPKWRPVTIAVSDFYEAAKPLVEETVDVTEGLAKQADGDLDALYITGGGSELPLVARVLREQFGRKVKRSAYMRSATAIGLAIAAARPAEFPVSDRMARSFGVWREADHGCNVAFDVLWEKGTTLPGPGEPELSIERAYVPVHNIGHFRFLECTHRDAQGRPSGDVTVWDDVYFAYDPQLKDRRDLQSQPIHRAHEPIQLVEEIYRCDAEGKLSVTIANRTTGYSRDFALARWSTATTAPIRPSRYRAAGS